MNNQRNIILAVVLSGLLLLGWDFALRVFYPDAQKPAEATQQIADMPLPGEGAGQPQPGQAATDAGSAVAGAKPQVADLQAELKSPARLPVKADALSGSINLAGAVLDDLTLNRHRATLSKDSGPVRIFSPAGTPDQHFAQFGWVGEGVALPDAQTRWQTNDARLSPQSPVTLHWNNGEGQTFTIRLEIDENYLITATQSLINTGAGPVVARPFALINRTSRNASQDTWTIHSGPIGAFDGAVEFGNDYKNVDEKTRITPSGRADWIGFTDIYWLSALIPQQGSAVSADFRALGDELYRADLIYQPATIPAGKQMTHTTRLFAGAKDSSVLDEYEASGIPNFGLAIDWGWFRWFERPIFLLLQKLFDLTSNFGVAIILLTVIIRGMMFPIAQKQFASMAGMRAVQPKMKALQERYKDDKPKLQQEMMALYKKEGVNPLAGCLPILIQIPIFFALYKVLMLTIEMRHQPFILWIKDLSAPDPLKILNLFGLLPFEPPAVLGIGILAVLLGATMWLQFKLNPAAVDPMQQQVFAIMPWVLMFVMAPFAAGLLLYWITSNILTITQQWYLYRQHPQLRAQAEKDRAEAARKKESKAGK